VLLRVCTVLRMCRSARNSSNGPASSSSWSVHTETRCEVEEFELTLSIGIPYEAEASHWACLVEVTRMFEPPREIYGIDSWQVVQLSFQFAAQLLEGFLSRGGRLFWKGFNEPVALHELFAHVETPSAAPPAA
jgi:hypothetical protein